MKGLFFDASATMLAKNLLPIANFFSSQSNDFQAFFISAEISSNISPEIENSSLKKILKDNKFSYRKETSFNKNRIEKCILSFKPDFIFIGAYRIYDQLWAGICKKNGIKVYKIQHGFEIDTVYYKPITVFNKIYKAFRLTYAAYNLAKVSQTSPVKLIYQYIKYLFTGTSLKNTLLNNELFHPTITFTYSEYYKEFWENKYGFNKHSMRIITPQDFLLLNTVSKKEKLDACCYIAQTLVEDGRLKEKEFISILKDYEKIASSVNKFIIKLHPRSNEKYYDQIKRLDNVELTRDFPNSKYYLTHYSSMLYTAAFFSTTLIIHELKGHPTPEIFKNIASDIVKLPNEIIQILHSNKNQPVPSLNERKESIKYYASFEEKNPYEVIYDEITKYPPACPSSEPRGKLPVVCNDN